MGHEQGERGHGQQEYHLFTWKNQRTTRQMTTATMTKVQNGCCWHCPDGTATGGALPSFQSAVMFPSHSPGTFFASKPQISHFLHQQETDWFRTRFFLSTKKELIGTEARAGDPFRHAISALQSSCWTKILMKKLIASPSLHFHRIEFHGVSSYLPMALPNCFLQRSQPPKTSLSYFRLQSLAAVSFRIMWTKKELCQTLRLSAIADLFGAETKKLNSIFSAR